MAVTWKVSDLATDVLLPFVIAIMTLSMTVDGELTGAGIDIRCKCVCPHQLINTTKQTVFISVIDDPEDCRCELVLRETVPTLDDQICLQCDCQHEIRNTWLIKLIVSVMLTIIGSMTLYLCTIHPLLYCYCKRKNRNLSVSQFQQETTIRSRVEHYPMRWRRNIEEQRQRNLS